MLLLHLLHELKYDITVAHCNFRLRGDESDGDAVLVTNVCEALQVPCFVKLFDTQLYAEQHQVSIQMAARDLRYQWFEELCRNHGYARICTAHHADDQAETILINLIRGTGPKGLTGIPIRNGKVVRPLLHFSKAELLAYANAHQIKWREDSSNQKEDYQRNLLRLKIIPELQKINPSLTETLLTLSEVMSETDYLANLSISQFLELRVEKGKDSTTLSTFELDRHPASKTILFSFLSAYGFRSGQMEMIARSLTGQPGKIFYASNYRAVLDRDRLIVTPVSISDPQISEVINSPDMTVTFCDGELTLRLAEPDLQEMTRNNDPHIAYLDAAEIKFPLTSRHWLKGDYFYPLGMDHQRKLSDYFTDRKLAVNEKEKVRLLLNGEQIIWIVSERIDQRYRLTENTKKVLELIWTPNE